MKSFEEYRNLYKGGDIGGGGIPEDIPEGPPEPKTFKEWAVAKLCGLDFEKPALEPKTPTEKYLAYAIENADAGIPGETTETT